MTRPVAEILEQAEREGWPTSYIDAMANHHLCGNLARDFFEPDLEPRDGGSLEGCGLSPRQGPHPPNPL